MLSSSVEFRALSDSSSRGRGMAVRLCLSSGKAKFGFLQKTRHRRGGFRLPMTFFWIHTKTYTDTSLSQIHSTTFDDLAGVLGFAGFNNFSGKRSDNKRESVRVFG